MTNTHLTEQQIAELTAKAHAIANPSPPEVKTKTWCFGQFQVEMPEEMSPFVTTDYTKDFAQKTIFVLGEHGGEWKYRYANIILPNETMTHDVFVKKMKAREDELKKSPNNEGGFMFVESNQPDENTRVIVRWQTNLGKIMVTTEGYKWVDGKVIHLDAEADDDHIKESAQDMVERLEILRSRKSDEIPNQKGFCVPDGIFVEGEARNGQIVLDFMFPGRDDVAFVFDIGKISKIDGPSLLNRVGGMMSKIGPEAHRVKTIRKEKRSIPGYPNGEEWMISAPGIDGTRDFSFIWEGDSDGTNEHPVVRVELTTGNFGKPSSMNEIEAIALWDRVLNTFKVRVVDPKTAQAQNLFPKSIAGGEKREEVRVQP
ncbi:MAG: hypothetical protein LBG61_01650 [Burkholderiales bacterium]|nr:hypothetical protein [Burkholderiales bacterium]